MATLKNGDLHRLYDEWKQSELAKAPTDPFDRPSGFGRYTREEFVQRIKAGKNWHEELRLNQLRKAREKSGFTNDKENA